MTITEVNGKPWPARSIEECHAIMGEKGRLWEVEEISIKGRKQKVYKNLPKSIRDFFKSTKMFGKREYIVYEGERYTYDQAHEKVAAIAELLRRRGIVKGDRVAICMRNYPEWILCLFAISSLGAVVTAINAWSPLEPLTHCFTNSGCKVAFIDEERAAVLAPSLSKVRQAGCESLFVVKAKKQLLAGYEDFELSLKGCYGVAIPHVDIEPEDNAAIYFTSGTTSLPKGVLTTQRQFLSNLPNSMCSANRAFLRRGDSLPTPDPKAPQRSLLLSVPLFHVTGCQSLLMLATVAGGKVVLMHKWQIDEAVRLIKREQVTTAGGVPHMVMEIIDALKGVEGHVLDGVSFGGAPSSDRLPSAMRSSVPSAFASVAYGLTETSAVATGHAAEDYLNRPKSCGACTPVTECKIMCPDKRVELPLGETGEIYLKGPNVAEGYWMDEKATKGAFLEDGWFASGDLGHMDSDGFLFISDRAKEIIIRGGENISTVQVENSIYRDERIKDVAVVPVPDPKLGELVCAVITVKSQFKGQVKEEGVKDLVGKHMPKHCVPVLVIIRQEDMPRNPTGKILKRVLKEEAGKIWEEHTKKEKVPAKL
ncbi:long-chain-fatty-acid-CoA ligase [Meredithblackwellia eburnea MCA 4105]